MIHSPKAWNSQDWASLKSGAGTPSVSPVYMGRTQVLEPSSTDLMHVSRKLDLEAQNIWDLNQALQYGMQVSQVMAQLIVPPCLPLIYFYFCL